MKTFIATVCLLAVICLPAAAESTENRGTQDTLKTRIYEGSVSVGVTYIINLGIRTTHGVRYLDKNLFLGGELWARKGFMVYYGDEIIRRLPAVTTGKEMGKFYRTFAHYW